MTPGAKEKIAKLLNDAPKYLKTYAYGYFELSKSFSNDDEENQNATLFLKNGRKQMGPYSNTYFIELGLAHRKVRKKGYEWARSKFKSLIEKYKDKNRDFAILHAYKCDAILRLEELDLDQFDETIQDLIEAKKMYSKLFIPPEHNENLVDKLDRFNSDRPEYRVVIATTFGVDPALENQEKIDVLLSVVETADLRRKEFVSEHLGRFFLIETKEFNRAADLFHELPVENEYRKWLLSETVVELYKVSDGGSNDDLQMRLLECLELGNCDVIEPILELLEGKKRRINLKNEIKRSGFFSGDQSQLFSVKIIMRFAPLSKMLLMSKMKHFF